MRHQLFKINPCLHSVFFVLLREIRGNSATYYLQKNPHRFLYEYIYLLLISQLISTIDTGRNKRSSQYQGSSASDPSLTKENRKNGWNEAVPESSSSHTYLNLRDDYNVENMKVFFICIALKTSFFSQVQFDTEKKRIFLKNSF